MISTAYPRAVYDTTNRFYKLRLDVKVADKFSVKIGGNIASSSINQGFAAVEYRNLGYTAQNMIILHCIQHLNAVPRNISNTLFPDKKRA